MEQPGARKEAWGVRQGMGKLFPIGGHEGADEADRYVAAAQNQGGVLEAVETGANPIPHLPSVASGRMAGT